MARVTAKRTVNIDVSSVEIENLLYNQFVEKFDSSTKVLPEKVRYDFKIERVCGNGCKKLCRCTHVVEKVTGVRIHWED